MKIRKLLSIMMVTFLLPFSILPISAADWQNPFVDVPSGQWFYEAVRFANINKLFVGVSNNRFAPDETMTRAMFVRALKNLNDRLGFNIPTETGSKGEDNYGKDVFDDNTPFTDVPLDEWYSDAVKWAYDRGIVAGYTSTEFGVDGYVSREEMCAFLYRFASKAGIELEPIREMNFNDMNRVSSWAQTPVKTMANAGVVGGVGGNRFAPTDTATRAEVAQIMKTFCAALQRANVDTGDIKFQ
ncbi:MAG: S-layer homology domain-containing protein [Clostridiales bacterium]|nr:S-layer homology domain-containing protein [Clostridiales bacterium]